MIVRNLCYFFAIGWGAGLLYAPGTMATLFIGVPLTLCIPFFCSSPLARMLLLIVSTMSAYVCIHYALPLFQNRQDPQEIVLDEVIGTFFACALGPQTLVSYVTRVALFRFFDISKLGPVGLSEQLPGALGILCDDVVAGILAHIVALWCGI